MEIKVRELNGSEQKSVAEVEEKLLKEHEQQLENTTTDSNKVEDGVDQVDSFKNNENVQPEEEAQELGLKDEDVLSYIRDRYNKEITSVDDLFTQQEANEDLPDDVKAFFEYKRETGRGIDDFVKLQKDYDVMDSSQLLTDYYSATEEGLDDIDIQDLIEDKFGYDEDLDDDKDIKKRKLAQKRELVKAKKFFNEQKDKYKIPLESSGSGLSDDAQEELQRYKGYIDESNNTQEQTKKRYDYFLNKTKEVFNDEFKGFEFEVGGNKINFKPGDAKELNSLQSNVSNFVNKYMDTETGLMNDPKGYHRALSMAMNPDKFAQFFYEQGVAATVDNVSKKSKNINMDVRPANQSVTKNGQTIRAISSDSSRGLKIRSTKKL
jgi:hypothetical protein|tara:strand:- start:5337 stop:6470 length:1134 start_codon:yes stop_codon:yes gene_type:complete